jgi:integrase
LAIKSVCAVLTAETSEDAFKLFCAEDPLIVITEMRLGTHSGLELLARLRKFYAFHKNPGWLFPGVGRGWKCSGTTLRQAMQRCPKSMNKSAVWAAIKLAVAESGLSKKHEHISTHTLRHSFGTHMLEGGASVRQVAAYLGHKSLKEVMTYLHLTEISESKGREALETLADC